MKWLSAGNLDSTFVGRACALGRGQALAVGTIGKYAPDIRAASFTWQPAKRIWEDAAPPGTVIAPTPGALVGLKDGRAACIGGRGAGRPRPTTLGTARAFDPNTGSWRELSSLVEAREYFAIGIFPDGRVMAIGGSGQDQIKMIASTEIYDPSLDSWQVAPALPEPRREHQAVCLAEGKILVAGGLSPTVGRDQDSGRATFLFDPISSSWTVCGQLGQARKFHSMIALGDGRAIVIGGWKGRAGALDSIELFDPATQQWSLAGVLLQRRCESAAALLPDGRVLISGGRADDDGQVFIFGSTEIWDPETGISTKGPTMRSPRRAHDLLVLPDGNMLAVGGSFEEVRETELLSLS